MLITIIVVGVFVFVAKIIIDTIEKRKSEEIDKSLDKYKEIISPYDKYFFEYIVGERKTPDRLEIYKSIKGLMDNVKTVGSIQNLIQLFLKKYSEEVRQHVPICGSNKEFNDEVFSKTHLFKQVKESEQKALEEALSTVSSLLLLYKQGLEAEQYANQRILNPNT